MPEEKRPLKVFLCHAHSDAEAVRALYNRLTSDGVDAWLDKEKLLPGQDWELEIRKAVREADVVVVCLSMQFNQAGFRQKEVRLALDTAMEQSEGEIFIIPARLEECDNLESLRKWHWVDLFEDDGYDWLMRALQVRAYRLDTNEKFIQSRKIIVPSLKIMVTGGRKVSRLAEKAAYAVGYQVINRGHVLISNGSIGVDRSSAEGALRACKEKSLSSDRFIQVFRPIEDTQPEFDFGKVKTVGQTYSQRKDYVVDISDAVIILGGGAGTKKIFNRAISVGKPLIPVGIGNPTEFAFDLWQRMFSGVIDAPITGDDLKKIGHKQDIETAAVNALILAENLALR
jgi:predicted Rossmann-fold nucleotide-binding protein